MRDFIKFLKAPVENKRIPANKILSVLSTFALIYILSILIFAACLIIFKGDVPKSSINKMTALPFWFTITIPPLVEELSFRLCLRRSPATILISSIFFFWCIVSLPMTDVMYSTDKLVLRCLIALAGGCTLTILFKKQLINANFRAIFYLSAIVFGLMHAGNCSDFVNIRGAIYAIIYLVLHVLIGLFYGYVRVGCGIFASYLFHLANNLLPMICIYML